MCENARGAEPDQSRPSVGTSFGCEDDNRDVVGPWIALERGYHLLPREVGKAQIKDDDIRRMVAREFDTEPAEHGRFDHHLGPAIEHALYQLDVYEVVLHVEDPGCRSASAITDLRVRAAAYDDIRQFGSCCELKRRCECGSDPCFTLSRQCSTHQLHQVAGERQAQP